MFVGLDVHKETIDVLIREPRKAVRAFVRALTPWW
jgi:hypothetical protein